MRNIIYDLHISESSREELINKISAAVSARTQMQVCAINVYKAAAIFSSDKLYKAVSKIEVLIPDGISILLFSRLLGGRHKGRITGISLFEDIIAEANRKGWKIFLLGAKKNVVSKTADIICEKFRGVILSGISDGYFHDADKVIEEINAKVPDILFVALGSPRQEYFIDKYRKHLNATIFMGVGGTFDVFSDMAPRAPALFQRIGCEWLYRSVREPGKYLKRYLITIPTFLFYIIISLLSRRK